MQRNSIIAITAAVLIAAAGFFIWRHMSQLSDQLGNLTQQVDTLDEKLVTAEGRATEAEGRATAAETRAAAAEAAKIEAAERAENALQREQLSAQQAQAAAAARRQAEQREQQAAMARQEAEVRAAEEAEARAVAEAKQRVAEDAKLEARLAAIAAEEEARQTQIKADKVRQKLLDELNRMHNALGRIAKTRRTALGLVMTLDSDQIEFDFNKANLRPENREVLSRIAGVLLTFDNYALQVYGHTDNIGSEEYNLTLSEQRANSVRDYLVATGVEAGVVTTKGLGQGSPLVEGTDPVSRQRNRRVELAIVFSEGDYEAIAEEEAQGPAEPG